MACFCFRTLSVFHILIYYNTMCVVRARLVVPSCSCCWSLVAGLDVGARCWSGLCLGSSSYWFGARSFTHPKVGFFLTPLSFSKFYIWSFKFWSFKFIFDVFQILYLVFQIGLSNLVFEIYIWLLFFFPWNFWSLLLRGGLSSSSFERFLLGGLLVCPSLWRRS